MNIKKLRNDITTLIIAMILGVVMAVIVYIILLCSLLSTIWLDIVNVVYNINKRRGFHHEK